MNFYYDVFGGSLRNLRSAYPKPSRLSSLITPDVFEMVLSLMNSFFGGWQLAQVPEETWRRTAIALAGRLMAVDRKKSEESLNADKIYHSVVFHSFPAEPIGWREVPATRFMRHLAGYVTGASTLTAFQKLKDLFGASGIGFAHEHGAHQFRLQHLGSEPGIKIWSLEGSKPERLSLPIKRVVRITSVKDIELLQEGDYGLPTPHNFPFVAAVMKPNYIFQDTTAETHDSTAKVLEILKALKLEAAGAKTVNLIFTVASDKFDSFKKNNCAELSAFSQWKTRLEVRANDSEITTAESSETISQAAPPKRKQIGNRKRKASVMTGGDHEQE